MFVKPGDTVRFVAFFQDKSTGLGVSGLTVKVAVNRGTTNAVSVASSTNASQLDATNQPGWYYYDYTVPAAYYGTLAASFTTTDTSVSQRGGASFYLSAEWVELAAKLTFDGSNRVSANVTAIADGLLTLAKFGSDTFLKLRKYFQLALRKDAGIATDNATELSELNADGGSGAGAFANTTDSAEAIRDRGDTEWATGSVDLTGLAQETTVNAVKGVTDAVALLLEDDEDTPRFTAHALTQAPSGGSAEVDVDAIAAASATAVWNKPESEVTMAGSIGKWFKDTLAAIRSRTNKIGAGAVFVRSDVDSSGNVTLYHGKKQVLHWTLDDARNLLAEGVTVEFQYGATALPVTVVGEPGAWELECEVITKRSVHPAEYAGELAVFEGAAEVDAAGEFRVTVKRNIGPAA